MNPPSVLCLHGSQQSSEIFRMKLGNLITKLKKKVNFIFADGPHQCALREGDEMATKTWLLRDLHTMKIIPDTLESSLVYLETIWNEAGNIIGIIGFSQGGTLAAILAAYPQRFPHLQFILIAGAPDAPDILSKISIPISVYSMHLGGISDTAVPINKSKDLSRRFHNPRFIEHDGGHFIPTKAMYLREYITFIEQHLHNIKVDALAIASEIRAPEEVDDRLVADQYKQQQQELLVTHLCSSEENAVSQAEEIDVLQSIYPTEVQVLSFPPSRMGQPCAVLSLYLPADITCENENHHSHQIWHARIVTELSLKFTCTSGYPNDMLPIVELERGSLSKVEFTPIMEASLTKCLTAQIHEHAGSPLAYICIQAVIDWLVMYGNDEKDKLLRPDDHQLHFEDDDHINETEAEEVILERNEVEERQNTEWIEQATKEAYEEAAGMRASSLHGGGVKSDDYNVFHEPPPPSARGIWNYTVGLIGKPSAGKSTFYNAVTKAALDREGRLMANVAPHPFTTIEPNVGPGWYCTTVDDLQYHAERTSLHGRYQGRRLLPVIVKDVAGLVPGAYKGRGKGNKFLNDLCDADVLIHLIDVTGKSDQDGNIINEEEEEEQQTISVRNDSKQSSSSPMKDAKWIREELHRWIHGNVYAKWSSVKRKDKSSDRIAALFSGYKGPKSCVERAAKRAQLDLDNASVWTALDIHRLVANYLTIRFPICLALNKIDMLPTANGDDLDIVRECQIKAEMQGEIAVPVSARAESWNILKQASSRSSTNNIAQRLPPEGSAAWLDNENCLRNVLGKYGSTGVLEAISAAVALRAPLLCYPVSDLDTEAPVGWTTSGKIIPILRDCLQFKPGSTVGDVYEALKRGALEHVILTGDFVRAEAKSLDFHSRKKQIGRDVMLDGNSNCVIRIQSNRKVVWQNIAASNK